MRMDTPFRPHARCYRSAVGTFSPQGRAIAYGREGGNKNWKHQGHEGDAKGTKRDEGRAKRAEIFFVVFVLPCRSCEAAKADRLRGLRVTSSSALSYAIALPLKGGR